MYYQTGIFYRFRFVLAVMSVLAAIILFSSLVTVLGSGTALASPIPSADSGINTDIADSPNVVTATAYSLGSGVEHLSLKTGAALYTGCHHITMASAHTGRVLLDSTTCYKCRNISSRVSYLKRRTTASFCEATSRPGYC
jgi:hypothetical protein